MIAVPLLAALFLMLVHLYSSRLRPFGVVPRSAWLSAAGGVAVAYVLVHLLPEIEEHSRTLEESGSFQGRGRWLYLLCLLGLTVFYGLEKTVRPADRSQTASSTKLFWLHVASYSGYNALLGYLLVWEYRDVSSMVLYVIGIGVHFFVNDYRLSQDHEVQYWRTGRWILSASILVGCITGIFVSVPEVVTGCITAFLTGSILLNTFKEELPEERRSNYWAFVAGTAGYAAVLMAI